MVHALQEVRRVLVPGGILLDIRPLADRWPVEVASGQGFRQTGRVDDLAEQVNADAASNAALQQAQAHGWFVREQEEFFPYFYNWDTPREMEEYIAEDWTDFAQLGEETKKATRSTWAIGEADSRVRVRVKVLITRWRAAR
jgi:SAM-dependent methyltransferase